MLTLAARAAEPIKLGVLEDQSGDFALATIGKVHGIQLAADEINKAGGIAGRPIELVVYDTQSDNTRFQEFIRRVLQKDKVDVVFAGFSSASREAYRPIVDQLNGFAFYNNQYEGGVCDAHMIVTGAVPEQQFSTLIPWMMEKFGKRVYAIAADYNFGQISAEWVRNIVKQNGGEMVGEEFIPFKNAYLYKTGLVWSMPARNDNAPLRDKLENALECMKLDGTLSKLYVKWFGVDPEPGSSTVTVYPGYGVPGMTGYDPTPHQPQC
jgi:ABC-type branched-subunit amino acid transport system substrate-binding protein